MTELVQVLGPKVVFLCFSTQGYVQGDVEDIVEQMGSARRGSSSVLPSCESLVRSLGCISGRTDGKRCHIFLSTNPGAHHRVSRLMVGGHATL